MWKSVDPLAEQFPAWNPYHYVHNNPINLVDPTGMSAVDGDYYDKQGNWLFNDGIDDNKVYEVSPMPGIAPGIEGSGANRIEYKGQVEDVFVTGDAATDSKIQNLHPAIRMKATNFMKEANSKSENTLIRIAQGLRTFDEQNDLYAKGRTTEGSIVTNAKGGYSNHNFGLAFDLVGITDGKVDYNLDWNSLSTMGKSHGFEWGGDWKSFKDKPHFQNMFGNSIQSLRNKYNSGNRVNGYVKF